MKPEQFIREFGEKKAKEVIEAAIDGSTHVIYKQADGLINLKDLKRLVESVDRVNAFGGLKDAKAVVKMGKHYKYLKAHISNYESIYGGGDE
ncbi:hypothetical protein [Acinetobacter baumannii]|uniref:hypothetical protein n=2 Tax=Acinetobacter baumannii TaxID=470 RepID=UPI00189B3F8D|nr:hypothetical protein [Acinetobacter baumannii]MBF6688020.1 hypothetical protein [Acinetobacter baumannii]MBF6718157.1 hypothetical protein [Acinetobacter baumannii]MBF6748643.1 hypothetical protein [Acinetobacter baumannii]MBF6845584.1 hypothetical protein [Acinetobacter baumannii]MBF6864211.1 hypothetical protein [Acinetobacter baumannii]